MGYDFEIEFNCNKLFSKKNRKLNYILPNTSKNGTNVKYLVYGGIDDHLKDLGILDGVFDVLQT